MHAQQVVPWHRPVSVCLASPCELFWPFSGQLRRPKVALSIPAAIPASFVAQMLAWLFAVLGPAGHFATTHVPVQHTQAVQLPDHSLVCCSEAAYPWHISHHCLACACSRNSPVADTPFVDGPPVPCLMLLHDRDWHVDVIKTRISTHPEAARLANQPQSLDSCALVKSTLHCVP